MSEFERKDDSMPEATPSFGEKVFKIAQEMDNNDATESVMLCPIEELPPDYEKQLSKELDRRVILVHGSAWIKCTESPIHDRAIRLLIDSIQNSEYFKRKGLYSGLQTFDIMRLHTCGQMSTKIADFAFDKLTSAGDLTGHVYGEVAFHNESPTLLLEEMVNALSPFHTFEISVGMKISSIDRNSFRVEIRTFVRSPLNFPSAEDVDQRGAMQKRSLEIQRAKVSSYNPREAARRFHPSRIVEFNDDFGVMQLDHREITVIRDQVTLPLTVQLTLEGDTFTLTSQDFSIMMHAYTTWWDRTHTQG